MTIATDTAALLELVWAAPLAGCASAGLAWSAGTTTGAAPSSTLFPLPAFLARTTCPPG